MEKSDSIKNLATALLKFHELVGVIPKDSNNPFFKSKYASLPDILRVIDKPLLESGLVITQFPSGNHELTTIVIHAESGEYIQDTYAMRPTKDDPQGIGSSITYQRRYAVGAVLSLNIDEDDDGNNASTPPKKPKTNEPDLPWLNEKDKGNWDKVVTAMKSGYTIDQIKTKWKVSVENQKKLLEQAK